MAVRFPLSRSHRPVARRGFTLVEILVASAIMALLTGLVLALTTNVLNVWNRSAGKLSANFQGRLAMDLLNQDLEAALFRNDGNQWFSAWVLDNLGPVTAQAAQVVFYSPVTDWPPEVPGSLSAVSYRMGYASPFRAGSGYDQYNLYRAVIQPQVTFDRMLGEENGQDDLRASFWEGGGVDFTPYSASGAASPTDTVTFSTATENIVSAHAVRFGLTLAYEDPGTGDLLDFADLTNGDPVTDGALAVANVSYGPDLVVGGNTIPNGRPVYLDVRLTVLTDEGARLLRASIDGNAPQTLTEIIDEFGVTFTRRIAFMNTSGL
ncbi:MAG: PulJ/GspJ family protein [Opitutales bacterium]